MFSKVYIVAFQSLREDLLLASENEPKWKPNTSRFTPFFNQIQLQVLKCEEQSQCQCQTQCQMEHLSTSDSSSSHKKVQPPKTLNIDIFKVLSREDRRTTVMLKNIPNKFTKEKLLGLLNQQFKGVFDMFIMPTNIQDNKNFGYAFINFTHSLHIVHFYHAFNQSNWEYTNSKKICQITYSKIQGKSKLKKHYPFKNTFIAEPALVSALTSASSSESSKRFTSSLSFVIPNVRLKFINAFIIH